MYVRLCVYITPFGLSTHTDHTTRSCGRVTFKEQVGRTGSKKRIMILLYRFCPGSRIGLTAYVYNMHEIAGLPECALRISALRSIANRKENNGAPRAEWKRCEQMNNKTALHVRYVYAHVQGE